VTLEIMFFIKCSFVYTIIEFAKLNPYCIDSHLVVAILFRANWPTPPSTPPLH
jgi:hypothetical protein